jgi:hypothetical protein
MRSGEREEGGTVSGRMGNKNRANDRQKKDKRKKRYTTIIYNYKTKIKQCKTQQLSVVHKHIPGICGFVIHIVFFHIIHGGCPRHFD